MEVRDMAKSLYETMKELGIKICPKCGKEYTEYPALSRKDNKTEICPNCGMLEALESVQGGLKNE